MEAVTASNGTSSWGANATWTFGATSGVANIVNGGCGGLDGFDDDGVVAPGRVVVVVVLGVLGLWGAAEGAGADRWAVDPKPPKPPAPVVARAVCFVRAINVMVGRDGFR